MAEKEKQEQKTKEAINAMENRRDESDSATPPYSNIHHPNPDQILMVMSQPQRSTETQMSYNAKPSLVFFYYLM